VQTKYIDHDCRFPVHSGTAVCRRRLQSRFTLRVRDNGRTRRRFALIVDPPAVARFVDDRLTSSGRRASPHRGRDARSRSATGSMLRCRRRRRWGGSPRERGSSRRSSITLYRRIPHRTERATNRYPLARAGTGLAVGVNPLGTAVGARSVSSESASADGTTTVSRPRHRPFRRSDADRLSPLTAGRLPPLGVSPSLNPAPESVAGPILGDVRERRASLTRARTDRVDWRSERSPSSTRLERGRRHRHRSQSSRKERRNRNSAPAVGHRRRGIAGFRAAATVVSRTTIDNTAILNGLYWFRSRVSSRVSAQITEDRRGIAASASKCLPGLSGDA